MIQTHTHTKKKVWKNTYQQVNKGETIFKIFVHLYIFLFFYNEHTDLLKFFKNQENYM